MPAPYALSQDVFALPLMSPAPPFGVAYCNAFLIRQPKPILVDTSAPKYRAEFLAALRSLVDPADIGWILLTHDDRDHSGNLMSLVEACPNARLVMNWFSFVRLSDEVDLPLHRLQVVNSGDTLTLGSRSLGVLRPPFFDAPSTVGFFDVRSRIYFSADCFGALTPSFVEDASALPPELFKSNFRTFNLANEPGIQGYRPERLAALLDEIRRLQPEVIASAHGAPVRGRTEAILALAAELPSLEPFPGLTQAELEQMLGVKKDPGQTESQAG